MNTWNVLALGLGLLIVGAVPAASGAETVGSTPSKTGKPSLEGVTRISGGMSHRLWVKTETENRGGVATAKRNFCERISLNADQTKGKWSWRLGISTLNSSNWTSSLVELARETSPGQDTKVLSYKDFAVSNAYVEYREKGRWSMRAGRTQHPFLKMKSEMLWDNDVFFEGIYLTRTIPGSRAKWNFHGGAYEIFRDLAHRDDRLYQFGILGNPEVGKTRYEWRLDCMSYDIGHLVSGARSTWQQQSRVDKGAYAPAYHLVNAYGAIDLPSQVRVTLDLSRNVSAAAPGAMNKGGDAVNATLVLGKLLRIGTLQSIVQYLKVGAQAVPPNFVSYMKRLNMQGFQWDVKFKVARAAEIHLMALDWKRVETAVPTDRRYRRFEMSLNHTF